MDPQLLGTATAFGLAASAGLNTTLPLVIVGFLARLGLLSLNEPFTALASDVALAGLVVLAALEILGDKVPGFDSVVHAVQWPLAAAAGAILFGSQTSAISSVSPGLTILVGLLTAGGVHAARAAARPAVTGLTLGTGNPLVSLAEDVYAVLLVLGAILAPAIGLALLVALLVGLGLAAAWSVRNGRAVTRRLLGRPKEVDPEPAGG
jgi:hypothetical protein